jgi:hypothetical protein
MSSTSDQMNALNNMMQQLCTQMNILMNENKEIKRELESNRLLLNNQSIQLEPASANNNHSNNNNQTSLSQDEQIRSIKLTQLSLLPPTFSLYDKNKTTLKGYILNIFKKQIIIFGTHSSLYTTHLIQALRNDNNLNSDAIKYNNEYKIRNNTTNDVPFEELCKALIEKHNDKYTNEIYKQILKDFKWIDNGYFSLQNLESTVENLKQNPSFIKDIFNKFTNIVNNINEEQDSDFVIETFIKTIPAEILDHMSTQMMNYRRLEEYFQEIESIIPKMIKINEARIKSQSISTSSSIIAIATTAQRDNKLYNYDNQNTKRNKLNNHTSSSSPICRFYKHHIEGSCKKGNKCNFLHVVNNSRSYNSSSATHQSSLTNTSTRSH